ncbi:hypothetical protein HII36_29435 [Nonomuraea sp. NN258]|uniref:hypothetical protein n=1 Tax=Nonomuraea antri TaxID=2730852 RepID=UPI00156926E0|nr:hypothetical protein [Nonomuraea antri]NRQ35925.1 hypothetical protein [Nonomuraea antri]
MPQLGDILIQLAVGVVPLGVAYLAFRSATDANRKTQQTALMQAERQAELERSKVDAEAYSRAKTIYEDALNQMDKHLTRVRDQAAQVGADLATEQNASLEMRRQIRQLQAQIRALERTVVALRAQIVAAGLSPVPASDLTGPFPIRPPGLE